MQWLVLFLVLVLGAATLIANDSRFIMLKPSITHTASPSSCCVPAGWVAICRRSRPKTCPGGSSSAAGYCWAVWMLTLAAANFVVAMNFDFQVWSWFFVIGLVGGKILAWSCNMPSDGPRSCANFAQHRPRPPEAKVAL